MNPRTKNILCCLCLYNTISLKLLRISSQYNSHLISTGPDYFLTRYLEIQGIKDQSTLLLYRFQSDSLSAFLN